MAGGVEVLEVTVNPKPGIFIKRGFDWGFARCPADIVFYFGHGSWGNGYLITHPSYDVWLDPIDMLEFWGNTTMASCPMDTDCLIINGCNVLYWDVNGHYKLKHDPNATPTRAITPPPSTITATGSAKRARSRGLSSCLSPAYIEALRSCISRRPAQRRRHSSFGGARSVSTDSCVQF
jgi:hypothetical protein